MQFKFNGKQIKETQTQYNNLITATSTTNKKLQKCLTKIEQNTKEKQTNTTKTEKIKQIEQQLTTELEEQLKKYKNKTTTLMDKTIMILNKKYKKPNTRKYK